MIYNSQLQFQTCSDSFSMPGDKWLPSSVMQFLLGKARRQDPYNALFGSQLFPRGLINSLIPT